jgi:hypothetical protein
MMMAMKLLFPRDTVAGAEEVIVARPRKVAGESVLDCCYNEKKNKELMVQMERSMLMLRSARFEMLEKEEAASKKKKKLCYS